MAKKKNSDAATQEEIEGEPIPPEGEPIPPEDTKHHNRQIDDSKLPIEKKSTITIGEFLATSKVVRKRGAYLSTAFTQMYTAKRREIKDGKEKEAKWPYRQPVSKWEELFMDYANKPMN